MTNYKSRSRYYDPSKNPAQTHFLVVTAFVLMLGGAVFLTLTSVFNQQQVTHCEQGWQPACASLQ